jgi:hypothetical protein
VPASSRQRSEKPHSKQWIDETLYERMCMMVDCLSSIWYEKVRLIIGWTRGFGCCSEWLWVGFGFAANHGFITSPDLKAGNRKE